MRITIKCLYSRAHIYLSNRSHSLSIVVAAGPGVHPLLCRSSLRCRWLAPHTSVVRLRESSHASSISTHVFIISYVFLIVFIIYQYNSYISICLIVISLESFFYPLIYY